MPSLSVAESAERWAPRYWLAKPFPPYRYVPGVHPHPQRDPAGHSYGSDVRSTSQPDWEPHDWPALSEWLWGVDLFNAFYFWEAHEAWERLWATKPRDSAPALLLQGLIQVAAALLKIRMGALSGAMILSKEGTEKIERASHERPTLMGLDLGRVVREFRHYFRPLERRTLPPVDASVPLLTLSGAPRT